MKELTQLEKYKNVFDELGIKYHEVVEDGWTYIQKYSAHDNKGTIHVSGYGNVPLKQSGQLTNFVEFDKEGKLASW